MLLTFVCLLLSVLSWDSILLSSSSCLECIFIFSVDISRIVTTSSNSTAASCLPVEHVLRLSLKNTVYHS